jgi:hypothetical protein
LAELEPQDSHIGKEARNRKGERIMTFTRRVVLCLAAAGVLALASAGTASASHLVPDVADIMLNKLVNNYRQTISPAACTGSGRTPGSHAPPFSFASCLPPAFLPGTAAALGSFPAGPPSNSSVLLTAVQDNPSTAVDEGDIGVEVHLKGVICLLAVCGGPGAPYMPVPGPAPDVNVRFKMRLNDHLNCSPSGCVGPFTSAGTDTDFTFAVPVDCTAAAPPASCDVVTSVDAVAGTPAAIAGGSSQNAQIFRIRVADAGVDNVLGNADDKEFAMQGLVVH